MASVGTGFSIEKAHKAQVLLSKKIVLRDRLPKRIRLVAGVDVAYTSDARASGRSVGAVTVLDYDSLELMEARTALYEDRFPYIPTLLSFREVPPAVGCIRKLHLQPDAFLVDGHGIAHPYRCGFASHLGLVMQKPTIGVAKSKLIGELGEKGENALLTYKGETVGSVVTTKQGFKPVYVSVGHMITLGRAIEIVKHCARGSRVPEPILRAHEIATEEARRIKYCERKE